MGATNTPATPNSTSKPKNPREKPIPLQPNSHTSRFLYLILKQVDLKHINWQDVADGTGISKGSAAKVKYGRFKRQIESVFLGEAIQVKREKEKEGMVKGEKDRDEDEGEEEEAAERGRDGLKRGGDESADVRKRIKLESEPRIKREDQRLPSIVSVDDDDEDENESVNSNSMTITSSPSWSPFMKPEPAEPGTNYNSSPIPYQPRSPVIKSEPGTSTGTCTGSIRLNLPIRRERINSTTTQPSTLASPQSQPRFYKPANQQQQTATTLISPNKPLRLASAAVLNREDQGQSCETGNGKGKEKGKGKGSEGDPVDID